MLRHHLATEVLDDYTFTTYTAIWSIVKCNMSIASGHGQRLRCHRGIGAFTPHFFLTPPSLPKMMTDMLKIDQIYQLHHINAKIQLLERLCSSFVSFLTPRVFFCHPHLTPQYFDAVATTGLESPVAYHVGQVQNVH